MPAGSNSAARHQRVKEIFAAVVEVHPSTREALLESMCGPDEDLRREVRSLLAAEEWPALDLTAAAAHLQGAMVSALDQLVSERLDRHDPAAHPKQVAEFRILNVLGEGGMGVVYLAEQDSPRRLVALKLVRPGFAGREILRRFRREADVLGTLRHPNIAQIYSAGSATIDVCGSAVSVPYFAMEHISGLPITDHCRRAGLSIAERVRLFLGVCDGVEHAHGRGVVHRDLKPANILVESGEPATLPSASASTTRQGGPTAAPQQQEARERRGDGASGLPKILDFGIARRDPTVDGGEVHSGAAATLHTAFDQIIGTLPYMSPEQLSGDPSRVDRRTDVYSLGVILYQILADHLPLDVAHRPLPEAARIVAEIEPTTLSTLVPACRGDLDTIVAKCLAKEPKHRYQTAAALAADLRRHLEDQPIEARPASGLYHLRKFARRNRGLVAGALLAAISLVAASVVSLVLARNAIEARNEAQTQLREAVMQIERSTQSYRILQIIVSAIAPRADGSPEPTLRQVLAMAEEELLSKPVEAPEVLGMFLSELARANRQIGDLETSDRLYSASLRNLRAASPESTRVPLSLAETLASAAEVADLQGRREEARSLRDESCERFEELLRAPRLDAPWRAYLHLRIGALRWTNGELEAAVQPLVTGIEIRRSEHPEGDAFTAGHEFLLGSILSALGRPLEAEAATRAAYETQVRIAPEDHPDRLKATSNLLMVVNQNGRFEEGRPIAEALLRTLERRGQDDSLAVVGRLNAGFGLIGAGHPRTALPQCRSVLSWRERHLGERHPDTARARAILATALLALGELDEAETLATQALEDHRSALGDANVRVAEDALVLTAIQREAGRPDQALGAARLAQQAILSFADERHALFGRALREEARAKAALGQFEDARVIAERARALMQATTAPGHPQLAECLIALGAIHLALGNASEAAALSRGATAELRKHQVGEVLLAPANALLGAALAVLGRVDEGEALLEQSLAVLEDALGASAPAVREAVRWRGMAGALVVKGESLPETR